MNRIRPCTPAGNVAGSSRSVCNPLTTKETPQPPLISSKSMGLLISGVVGLLVVKGLQTLRLDPATFPPELQGLIRFINSGDPVHLHSS